MTMNPQNAANFTLHFMTQNQVDRVDVSNDDNNDDDANDDDDDDDADDCNADDDCWCTYDEEGAGAVVV